MTAQNDIIEIREHLAARLLETATDLGRDRVLPEADIAVAFVMTGATIVACHAGPVAAAEWLRDLADTIERAEKGLRGPMQ